MIKYHIKRCRDIGALDYCDIFIKLKNADSYKWLSFVYNDVIRSAFYNDYVELCRREKALKEREEDWMALNLVKYGSRNEETRAIQQIMMDEGYDLEPYNDDGIYGDLTKAAVINWQQDNGLKVDGIVGQKLAMVIENVPQQL